MGVISRCFGTRRVLRSGMKAKGDLASYRVGAFCPTSGRRASASRAPVGFDAGVFGYARLCSSVGVLRNGNPSFAREALPSERGAAYTGTGGIISRLGGVLFDGHLSTMRSGHPRELVFLLASFLRFSSVFNLTGFRSTSETIK